MSALDPRHGQGLVDRHGRTIGYLRLSVTDRCNLHCSYCMPLDEPPPPRATDLLDDDELLFLARVAVARGVRKIRITGGEPLVRRGIVGLLARIGRLEGLDELAMTTNGSRLEPLAGPLKRAGLRSVNVSIDSLRPDRFRKISGGGHLEACRDGISAALVAGLKTKLNVVVMRGVNDDEITDFVRFGLELGTPVRFIEHMPTGGRSTPYDLTVPSDEVLERIAREFGLSPVAGPRDARSAQAGPSRDYRIDGTAGTVGVISPLSHRFCGLCNRIRVTATGSIRGCLFEDRETDLRPLLRARDEEGLGEALNRAVLDKPASHRLNGQFVPDLVHMSRMGG